ncbi:hypothetical protein [Hymenobacter perfusus]|uniref:Uncharacterized protein n=1 Tax=Hymenobacter perfusus TaxID=1236770 RepID=A0A3R9MEQ8_9BACT|nr:hypothetical protein [Hymenobacter perfusus]RSK44198.1 hypothetical protein EI293_06560 [Hymenobacter perfusus]
MSAQFSTSWAALFSTLAQAGWRATMLSAAPAGCAVHGRFALARIEPNQGLARLLPGTSFPFLLR